jgi:hypothetical protein
VTARVLKVGEGYHDPEGDLPLDTRPGEIIEVPWTAITWYSTFQAMQGYEPDTIGLTVESAIRMKWQNDEHYQEFWKQLNETDK